MAYVSLNALSAITTFLLILLASLLLTSSKSTTSARILAVFLLLHALLLAGELINQSEFVLGRPGLAFWTIPIPLLFGPLLWLYTNGILFKDFHYRRKLVWHFLPFVIGLLAIVGFYQFETYNDQIRVLMIIRDLPRDSDTINLYSLVCFTHTWVYLIFSFGKIRFYRNEINHLYSTTDTIHVNWLVSLLSVYGILIMGIIVNSILGFSSFALQAEFAIIGLVMTLVIYFTSIFYRALTFPNFFSGIAQQSTEVPLDISKDTQSEVMASIDKLVYEKALFTKSYLTLLDLEEKTDQPASVIVHVLRQEKEMTFNEYINRTRIELARRLLSDRGIGNVSELEIMYDCGFNTPTSFQRAFKKYTGKQPSEIRPEGKKTPSKGV